MSDELKPDPQDLFDSRPSAGPSDLIARHDEIRQVKRRGRKPKDATPFPSLPPPSPIFTPENTSRLLRVPFTLAAIKTDCDVWLLDEKEEKELSASAVPMLNEFVAVEPKWVALSLFAVSLISMVGSKTINYAAYVEAKRIREMEARKNSGPVPSESPKPQRTEVLGETRIP